MAESSAIGPTPEAERIHALDAMRGLAIFGVLVAYTVWNLGGPPEEAWRSADHAVARGMDLLVDNKFLTIFAWLFGVGIAQQWRRWEAAGWNPVSLHLRRMAFLFGIGLLHAVFLRNGDILAPYALLGLSLLAFRRGRTSRVAAAAVLLLAAPHVVEALAPAVGLRWPERPSASTGSYLADNLAWLGYWYATNPLLSWPRILAVMLAGLLTGRAGLVERLARSRQLAGRALAVAAPVAVLAPLALESLRLRWTAEAPALGRSVTLNLLYQLSVWALAASYGAALLLASQWTKWAAPLRPMRALGRMAFTNYLLQALIVVPFCLAFGLFDRMTPTRGLWLALAVGALQLRLSTWWLRRFPMGPLERVWRGVTYGSANRAALRIATGP